MTLKKGYKQLLAEAEAMITAHDPAEAVQRAAQGAATLVDIRDVRELDRDGRIDGAAHCPRGMLEFWIDPDSPYHKPMFAEDKEIIFFCASAWRSALAARTAMEMGLPRVAHMRGGYKAWKAWREGGSDAAI